MGTQSKAFRAGTNREVDPFRARKLLRRRAVDVRREWERVRRRARPAAVHDLRVATRRLQEALTFLEPILAARPSRRLFRRARRIRRELGEIRNADVMLDLLDGLRRRLPAPGRRALAPLRRRLKADAEALRRAAAAGPGVPLPGIRRRIRSALESLRDGPAPALAGRARALLAGRSSALRRAVPPARKGGAEAMHRLRIRIKKYRYALEILEEMGRKDLRDRINAARKAQQELGRLHDLDVLIDLAGRSGSFAARAQLSRRLRAERAARVSRALAALAPLRARRSPGARPVAGSRR